MNYETSSQNKRYYNYNTNLGHILNFRKFYVKAYAYYCAYVVKSPEPHRT